MEIGQKRFFWCENIMRIGITGTAKGATQAQKEFLEEFFQLNPPEELHHGDCIGVDAEAHDICRRVSPSTKIIVHPPLDPKARAFKQGDIVLPEKYYLDRNHDIVDQVDFMIACPKTSKEELRSGTWATVRYARRAKRPIHICWPEM
ncbi:hypothetical protein HYV22_02835 [Candidatus Gottesmanbacteria bacterium]|nr:hypothetical protein [Candidatus Gottesmanbacteria bacterium]